MTIIEWISSLKNHRHKNYQKFIFRAGVTNGPVKQKTNHVCMSCQCELITVVAQIVILDSWCRQQFVMA